MHVTKLRRNKIVDKCLQKLENIVRYKQMYEKTSQYTALCSGRRYVVYLMTFPGQYKWNRHIFKPQEKYSCWIKGNS